MHPPRMIPDDRFFREIWRGSVSVVDIAVIYGTSRAAIYRAALRFGHGQRNPPEIYEEKPVPRPDGYEAQLLWSKGRWAILREIADAYGRSMTQVQADFHRARANAGTNADRAVAAGCAEAERARSDA